MRKRRFVLVFVLFLLLVLLIKTGAYYILVSLVIIFSLLMVSGISMWVKKDSIQLSFATCDELVIETSGIFPLGKIEASVEIFNPFYNIFEKYPLELMLGQKESHVKLHYDQGRMGNLQIKIQSNKRIDMLSLFSIPFKQELQTSVLLAPEAVSSANEMMIFQSVLHECFHSDYEIREYRDGDSIRDIHYKMSYKMNKTLIKEYLRNGGHSVRILLDLSDDQCEEIFQSFLGFAHYLVSSHSLSEIYWFSGTKLMSQSLLTQEDLNQLMVSILSHEKATCFQEVPVDLIYSSKGLTLKGGGNRG